MPFPTDATLEDDFNRANEDPVNTNWDTVTGVDNLQVLSNELAATATGNNAMVWGTAPSSADCECGIFVPTLPTSGQEVAVIVRGQDVGSGATFDGYWVGFVPVSGEIRINRLDNGSLLGTDLSAVSVTFSAGHGIAAQMVGDIIYSYHHNGTSWVEVDSYDISGDATQYNSAGATAVFMIGTTARCDNWYSGNFVAPAVKDMIGAGILPFAR